MSGLRIVACVNACRDMGSAGAAITAAGGACVVKADGLAAGKGVVVADTADEAAAAAALSGGWEAGSRACPEALSDRRAHACMHASRPRGPVARGGLQAASCRPGAY